MTRCGSRQRPLRSEVGTGLIASTAGFAVFLTLMLLAVQVLFDLYARSAVTAAAFDAARRVAGFPAASLAPAQLAQAEQEAETQARQTLGRYGRFPQFDWNVTAADVVLRVRVRNPSVLPAGISRGLGIDSIDRTVRVHAERLVCATGDPCQASPDPPSGISSP